MQPVDTMTISLHLSRSNAGSIIKHAITLLQDSGVQVEAGHIINGPMVDRIDLEGVILRDVLDYLAALCGPLHIVGVIELAGRIHFGAAPAIASWIAAHPIIFAMDCPFCNGAGCPKCNDTGKTYRTA